MTLQNETLLTGWENGKLVFIKSYNYEKEKEQCQKDIEMLADKNISWQVGLAENQLKDEEALKLLERARGLVGNPGTNISGSTDIACDEWHKDYDAWKS